MVGEISIKGGDLMGQADQHPIRVVQAKFKGWLAKQSLPVEAAVVAVGGAADGAVLGALLWKLCGDYASKMAIPLASHTQVLARAGGPLVHARNFAVMKGVNAGVTCVMRRVGGKEDVQSSIAASFCSGAMFSLVGGMGGPNQALNVVTSSLLFAIFEGGRFQFAQKLSQPPQAEDLNYVKTKCMLSDLGLQNYEKNFKRGLLSDSTLPLLNDSALRDVKIPPGPRLLILDHIDRNPELKGRRK